MEEVIAVEAYLRAVHPLASGVISTYIYEHVGSENMEKYIKCLKWTHSLMDVCDPVTSKGEHVVERLYALFRAYPNLTEEMVEQIMECCVAQIVGIGVSTPLIPEMTWQMFHSDECNVSVVGEWYEGCDCEPDADFYLQRIAQVMCNANNDRISEVSRLWDESEGLIEWLPKEIMEDVVWLSGMGTTDSEMSVV